MPGYKLISISGLSPEKVFLALVLFFGVLWTFIVPPFQAPDEVAHIRRAAALSEGLFYPVVRGGVRGNETPAFVYELAQRFGSDAIRFKPHEKQDISAVISSAGIKDYDLRFTPYKEFWAPYPPSLFIPQIFAYSLSRMAGLPAILCIWLMRLFNLFLWTALVYFSIKLSPVAKWGMVVLALLPMGVFEAASAAVDPSVNGTAFLYTALVFRYAFAEKPERIPAWTVLLLFLLPFFFCVGKVVYLPLTLLPLTIPRKCFEGGGKKYAFVATSLTLCALATYLWQASIAPFLLWDGPGEKFGNLLAHPVKWLYYGLYCFRTQGMYSQLYVPGVLGWDDTALGRAPRYISLFLIFAAFITGAGGKRAYISLWQKVFIFSLFGACTLLLLFALTSPETGNGLQGRYFIPLGPILFSLLYSRRINAMMTSNKGKNLLVYRRAAVSFSMMAVLIIATWKIIARYYVISA